MLDRQVLGDLATCRFMDFPLRTLGSGRIAAPDHAIPFGLFSSRPPETELIINIFYSYRAKATASRVICGQMELARSAPRPCQR